MGADNSPRFKDYFSKQAALYAKYRPQYPRELYDFLANHAPSRRRVWDCATGNGQAALSLTEFFDEIIATDASESQIAQATPHPKIKYAVAPAEDCPLIETGSVDLLTIASALHWLDFERFYKEARRVLVPGGVIAAWVFHQTDGDSEFDRLIDHFQHEIVGAGFPEETRKWVWSDYKTLPFPFEPIGAPQFRLRFKWTVDEVVGYLTTWSATQRYIEQRASNPVELICGDLVRIAAKSGGVIEGAWKLLLRVGRRS